jgi:creatinine amidohydrolase
MFSFLSSTKQLSDSGTDTAIISVGATEGCGPCLPLHLDTLLAEYFGSAWGGALDAYVLPTLPFNTSEEHAAFKGTITLRPATVMLVLGEIVAGLRDQGFSKQVLTVGHGGSWWMGTFIKDINFQFKDIIVINVHHGAHPIWDQALRQAGLPKGELHGGILSRALASYLTLGDLLDGPYGRDVPEEMIAYNGYVT